MTFPYELIISATICHTDDDFFTPYAVALMGDKQITAEYGHYHRDIKDAKRELGNHLVKIAKRLETKFGAW